MCSVYVKVHRFQGYVLVAVCDEELLGKILNERDICFDVSEKFFKGLKMSVEEAIALIRNADTANLIGVTIVNRAVEERLVHPEAVANIAGIPHAQIVKL
ncbi:DUF424 family protein [Candidatus Bathyarchaeota archaeon]|nr:DUF424 family protein [Candidatus Bathyarchaeota archaeon]MBS7612664.1 DUF424 family protein [Candidatus Bathyarchaeota archaeon]MBS7617839.1 DUF424 family protein [Candidatus Bathyarchaeota archaeon]